jgi:VCBS repeat-containing protein
MSSRRRTRGWNTSAHVQTLESRTLLSNLAMQSLTADGFSQVILTYELDSQAPAFNINFYRSSDRSYGGDTLIDTVALSAPADLTPGLHVKTFAIGSGASLVGLPGAGSAEVAESYSIFGVASLVDSVFADNVALFEGVYHLPTKEVFVQTGGAADTVSIDATARLTVNGRSYAYAATDVSRFRVRTHDGDDLVDGVSAAKALWVHAGSGNDTLVGGTVADTLFGGAGDDSFSGGRGNDVFDGGDGSDAYLAIGSVDGTDRIQDTGASGVDRILARANATLIRVAGPFSQSGSGIEEISANGFSEVSINAASGDDSLNFSGMTLTGITVIDSGAGIDTVVAGAGDEVIRGGDGNDTITGGAGRDVAVFAGNQASYSIVVSEGVVKVTDLDPLTHGNDGIDTLQGVEFLRFRDGETLAPSANTPPVAANDVFAFSEDIASTIIDVLANDTDVDYGDTKRVIEVDGSGTDGWLELIIIYGVGVGVWHPGIPAILGTASPAPDGQGILYSTAGALQGLRSGQTATEQIFYVMADAAGAPSAAAVTLTITGVNDAPIAVADFLDLAGNAAPQTIAVLANDTDVDVGDTKRVVSVNTTGLRGAVSIAADGSNVVYTMGDAFLSLLDGETATETFRYTMSDADGALSTAVVTLTIRGGNDTPVAVNDSALATENGAAVVIDVLANDTDPDAGDTKKVVGVAAAGLSGSVAIASDGSNVVYTIGSAFQHLKAGETAVETFAYTMQDAGGASSTAHVSVTVTGINDNPVARPDTVSIGEDDAPKTFDVLANDTDADAGDTRQVIAVDGSRLKGSVVISPDGTSVIYSVGSTLQSLRVGQVATETFTYTMVDSAGVQSTATVTVTVAGANDAPVAAANAVSVFEDTASVVIPVLGNDTDADTGDTKRVVSVDTTGLQGTVRIPANGGSVTYVVGRAFQMLTTGQTATDTFTYTMADSAGALSTATVTVTVTGSTDGPIPNPDGVAAHEDGGQISIDVLANDQNDLGLESSHSIVSIDGNGSPATIELIIIYGVGVGIVNPGFPAVKGTIAIAPDGKSVLYTPHQSLKAGQTEVDFFKYTVGDSSGRMRTAIVSVTVTGANDGPIAVADTLTVAYNAPPTSIDVLANDTDLDADDTKRVVSVDGSGLLGSVAMAADGSGVSYSVGDAFLGLSFGQTATETFSYTMADAAGLQSTASVVVTVTGRNQAPTAVDDAATAYEDGAPITIAVLENDIDGDLAAGDTRTLVSFDASGLQGTVSLSADGNSLIYDVGSAFQHLKAGATAVETFTYIMQDSLGVQSSATVAVTVTGVNDGPTAVADSKTISEDSSTISLDVRENDIEIDEDDPLQVVTIDTTGVLGQVSIGSGGLAINYTVGGAFQHLNNGETATETFSYTIRDSAGAVSTALVTITIVGANEPVVYVNPPPPPPGAIVGGAGDDIITGTSGADVIYGQAGDDQIAAGDGNDTVFGGAGRDTIDGGDGNDIINGGSDRDDLTGGKGADTFRYYLASESTPAGFDRIRDFDRLQGDKIDLSLIDASTVVGGNNAFVIANAFTRVAGQLVLTAGSSGVWTVLGDVNGDGVADLQIEVRSKSTLTFEDFVL